MRNRCCSVGWGTIDRVARSQHSEVYYRSIPARFMSLARARPISCGLKNCSETWPVTTTIFLLHSAQVQRSRATSVETCRAVPLWPLTMWLRLSRIHVICQDEIDSQDERRPHPCLIGLYTSEQLMVRLTEGSLVLNLTVPTLPTPDLPPTRAHHGLPAFWHGNKDRHRSLSMMAVKGQDKSGVMRKRWITRLEDSTLQVRCSRSELFWCTNGTNLSHSRTYCDEDNCNDTSTIPFPNAPAYRVTPYLAIVSLKPACGALR